MALKPLVIHFLNVGKGDCTIIEHPSNRVSMIDINNSKTLEKDTEEEILRKFYGLDRDRYGPLQYLLLRETKLKEYTIGLEDPVEYYKRVTGKKEVFRFIATHPDMDHLSGLYRLRQEMSLGNIPSLLNFWDTNNNEEKEGPWDQYDKRDWDEYQRLRRSKTAPKCLINRRGDSNKYWNQDEIGGEGDYVHIWSPTEELEEITNEGGSINILSYVLFIKYGKCKIVLGGDAINDVTWQDIYDCFNENGSLPQIDILKASHHGTKTGYHQPSVEQMSPRYTIISIGRKDEYDASGLYDQYSDEVLSTRWWGNILAVCYETGDIFILTQHNRRNSQQRYANGWLLPEK